MIAAEKTMVLPAFAGALDPKDKRETALITGASSGIGLDLAQLMAPDFDLIITARNQTDLETSHGNHVHVIPADLTMLGRELFGREVKHQSFGAVAGFVDFLSTVIEVEDHRLISRGKSITKADQIEIGSVTRGLAIPTQSFPGAWT
jgi:hypothetical protein